MIEYRDQRHEHDDERDSLEVKNGGGVKDIPENGDYRHGGSVYPFKLVQEVEDVEEENCRTDDIRKEEEIGKRLYKEHIMPHSTSAEMVPVPQFVHHEMERQGGLIVRIEFDGGVPVRIDHYVVRRLRTRRVDEAHQVSYLVDPGGLTPPGVIRSIVHVIVYRHNC